MKLSIVIPVYNVEKYVEKCILSCRDQNVPLDEYEIIIINDGSKDNSLKIVNQAIKGANNISVFSQENSGLSVARNTGLSYAKGEYVWFIDSDDYIEPDCLRDIFDYLDGKLDILQIQYRYIYESGKPNEYPKKTIIDGEKKGMEVLISSGVAIPAQFSIYRRDFLKKNKLEFYPNIYHEDVDFKPRAVYMANRMTSYNGVVYNYLQRDNSIMAKKGLKNASDLLFIAQRMFEFQNDVKNEAVPYFSKAIACCINWVLIIMTDLNKEERQKMKDTIKENRHLLKAMTRSDTKQYRYEAYLLLANFDLGRWAYLKLRELPQYGPNRVKEK